MKMEDLVKALHKEMAYPVLPEYDIGSRKAGLVVIDIVNGFVAPGAGALAPPAQDDDIDRMVQKANKLAEMFYMAGLPILVLNECHEPGVPEPPYPPHCEQGSGEEILHQDLYWLYNRAETVSFKNCINGYIGAIRSDGSNAIADWVNDCQVEVMVVVGICTDICVMQFVQSMLSARNKVFSDYSRLMPALSNVVVCTEAVATYDLPTAIAESDPNLTVHDAHPRKLADFIGLYLMSRSGAILAKKIKV